MEAKATILIKNGKNHYFLAILAAMSIMFSFVFKLNAQSDAVVLPEMDKIGQDTYNHPVVIQSNTTYKPDILHDNGDNSLQKIMLNTNNNGFSAVKIFENRPEDKLHPEYGKIRLDNKTDAEELIPMRTQNSRTFKNSDSTYSIQQNFGALHYQKNGKWLSIDNKLASEKGNASVFMLSKTDLPIMINAGTGETRMQLAPTGEGIVFGKNSLMQFIDENANVIKSVASKPDNSFTKNDNLISMSNFWNSVNRNQKVDYWQVKTDYVITQKPNANLAGGTIVFTEFVTLPQGWKITEGNGKQSNYGWQGELLILNSKGEQKGKFELPVYYDNYKPVDKDNVTNHAIEGAYQYRIKGNIVELSTIVPADWLMESQRVFPVTIDPVASNTYRDGDIPTDEGFRNLPGSSTCPGTMTVIVPPGAVISSLDVSYKMTAQNLGYMNEQRSQLRCVSPGGTSEGSVSSGFGNSGGTYSYSRTGLNLANGVAGGNVAFELHAGRTWGGLGCNTTYNKVDNNTWQIIMQYTFTPANTYYSYQNGNWEDASTWTTDPSGTLSVSPTVPGAGDKVVILNGRTVTANSNNKTNAVVEIQDGSILNLGATTGHTFYTLQGQGRLRTSATTLPAGNMEYFVAATGGTIEYYGAGSFTFDRNIFNNLILNFSNAAAVATIAADFTVNGDLTIQSGDLRIGNSTTSRTVSALKNVILLSAGKVSVHTDGAHYFDLYGDLTVNSGASFKLHNLAAPSYETAITNGKADLRCVNGIANQTIIANGQLEPYWIIINKGTDQTYTVDVQASGDYFKLFGHTFHSNNSSINLVNGTLKLGANIIIPHFMHSTRADYSGVGANDGQFRIPESCHLWIDGASVTTTSVGGSIYRGDLFFVYGKFTISAGSFYDNSHRGIILASNGLIHINGGTVSTSIIRSAWMSGVHRGTYVQTGGTVEIRRDIETTRANGANFNASFMMSYQENVFQMTGGILNILNSTIAGSSGEHFSLILGMKTSNVLSSGGTINITVPDNRNAKILSTGSLSNLNIISSSNTYRAYLSEYTGFIDDVTVITSPIAIQPLVVKNAFSISNPARFDAANQNVTIGGDFTIAAGATYIPGTNTTIFNGSAGQVFTNAGNITSGLYNMEVTNNSILSITNTLIVRNNFTSGAQILFRDMGYLVNIAGNIVHEGTHQSQTNGGITLNGTGAQTISGNGQFDNLNLNKTSGSTTALSNLTINGNLRLANSAAILNIGTYRLAFAANSGIYDNMNTNTTAAFSVNRMIQSSGNMSDGGVKFKFAAISAKLYPIGVSGKYTKANVTFTGTPTHWGSITIRPVNSYHPLRTSDNALDYYWRVSYDSLTGITAGMLEQRFYYDESDLHGTEADYRPGVYNPVAWTYATTDKVSDLSNEILFDAITTPAGDFTAGYADAFGAVNAYYSWATGQWTTPATWSTSKTVYTPPATAPTATSAVVIQSGHTITINANSQNSGYLIIEENATLDLGTTTGHNFGALDNGQVTGKGLLRISSAAATAQFPGGDFAEFLGEDGGTVEYYYSATNFRLPASGPYTYYNLIINASGRILQPDYDFIVYNNFTKTGANDFRLNAGSTNSIDIRGDLIIGQGSFQFFNNAVQTIKVSGNVEINGTLSVANQNGASNILEVYGDIINNGTLDLYVSETRNANLYFLGTSEQTLSGTGATTDFYKITVNKGSSQNYMVNVTASNFTIYTGIAQTLAINSGTIKFNGPTSTVSGNFNFNIPETACLAVAGGTITVGGDNNAADILLAGKVQVSGGTLNLGLGNNFNNDIEIAGAGAPSIEVSGGTLTVNGQIRRSTTSVAGALRFTQSGGNIYVNGRNRQATRALLEVVNAGSEFNTTGNGNLYLVNGGGTTCGDLYLNAENYTAEGGTIILGTGSTAGGSSTFNIYLGNPIWSLTVDGTTNAKTAILKSFPANIYGNLQISNSGSGLASIFNVGNLDVNIGGDFINYASASANPYVTAVGQVTTFIGKKATQALTNSTNLLRFRVLAVNHSSNTGVVTFSGGQQIMVYEKLKIDKGIFEANNQLVSLIGDLYNENIYRSVGTGYIYFYDAPVNQSIYGKDGAQFGSFRVQAGKKVYTQIDMNVSGNIHLYSPNAYLYLSDKKLSLSANTTITSPGATNYIITNGALSDGGVSRTWSGTGSFTFPIGIAGKYTPVTMNVTNTGGSAGTITIKPVNSYHPAVQTGFGNDELQYYWNVTSQNFGASPTVTHTYNYLDADVQGTEGSYVAGRFFNYQWVPDNGIAGTVNATNNTITLTGVNYINGEYTAGIPANFVSKPILYSRVVTGNWEDVNSWSTSPSGTPIASDAPDGNPVVIQAGHTISTTANGAYAYSVNIANTAVLALGSTREHNFGHVSGSGTIKISATASGSFIFPGGFYDDFMNTSGSTIEYDGTGTLPSSITTYQNVAYSGVGSVKYISAINYTVLGNLEIRQGELNNTLYNRNITVNGNWINNVASGFKCGTGLVTFSGLNSQITATGSENFFNLRINRAGGTLTLNSPVTVSRYLYLTDGKIVTTATNILTLSWTSSNAVVGGSTSSFVDGPLRKNISSGDAFYFPVGDANRYASTRVFTTSAAGYWTTEYFNQAPANAANLAVPLKAVSTNEYWTIIGPASSTAKVLLRWDAVSDPIPATPAGRQQLRVAQYLSSNWTGLSSQVTDNVTTGTVQTTINTSTNGEQFFTIGFNNVATARIIGYDTAICNDGSTMPVVVEFTGAGPWNLTYTINGANATTLTNIGANPYPIVFQYNNLFSISGAADYVIKLTEVYSGGSEGFTLPDSAVLTLKTTPAPIITGASRVMTSSSETYSVQLVANETYAWTVSANGTISGAANNRTVLIDWGAATGAAWVEVTVTNTVTGCTKTERLDVTISNWPVISGFTTVCSNGEYTYTTTNIMGHTYLWSIVGGTIIGANNNATVNVTWGTEAAGSISVEQSDGIDTETDSRNVTINNSGNNTWNGSQDSLWTNVNNWNCNCSPVASQNIIVNSGTANIPVISEATATQIRNLNLQTGAMLRLKNTASLTISNSLQLNGLIAAVDNAFVQLGIDAGNLGTLSYSGGKIIGLFKRWVSGSGVDIDFPLGTTAHNRWVRMRYTTAPTAGILTANYVTNGLESIFTTGDLYGNMPFSDDTIWIDNISQRGLWSVNPNAVDGVSGGTYDIKFYTHGIAEILDPNRLRMIKRSASSGDWVIPGTHGGVELIDEASFTYWVSRTGVTTFSYYALAGKISENPLPITLTSFTGKWNNGNVLLNWITQSETNNDYFIVERSKDMKVFSEIGSIKSKGNSHVTTKYSLIDEKISDAGYYYKLKQVDFDGTTTDLSTVFVKVPVLNDDMVRVYPQPAKELLNVEVKLSYKNTVQLEILNSLGNSVLIEKYELDAGMQLLQLNTREFVPGYYVLIVKDGANIYRKQIIVGLK